LTETAAGSYVRRVRHIAFALLVAVALAASARAEPPSGRPLRLQDVPWYVGTPKEIPDRVPDRSGAGKEIRVRVGRIWREGEKTHASVNVRNVAAFEFHDVTLVCTAFDPRDQAVGSREADLTTEGYGAIKPGFVANLDLVFDTPRSQVRSLACDARARGLPHRID
jgi:hypothetical protein